MTTGAWTVEDLDARARELPKPERARLVALLVRGLASPDSQIEAAWLDEAEWRDRELDSHPEQAISADEVLRRARLRLE